MTSRPHPTTVEDDTDIELLWQSAARAETVLEGLASGESISQPLGSLLGYLRDVLLARINEEEGGVVPALLVAGLAQTDIDRLHNDHLALREATDDLAEAAGAVDLDPAHLRTVVQRLIARLDEHLRSEAAVLTSLPDHYRPRQPRWAEAEHWYPLTEGSVIDLRLLHADVADDAVLTRLTRLAAGEQVILTSDAPLDRLWRRVDLRQPREFTWAPSHSAAGGWTVAVTRRPAT